MHLLSGLHSRPQLAVAALHVEGVKLAVAVWLVTVLGVEAAAALLGPLSHPSHRLRRADSLETVIYEAMDHLEPNVAEMKQVEHTPVADIEVADRSSEPGVDVKGGPGVDVAEVRAKMEPDAAGSVAVGAVQPAAAALVAAAFGSTELSIVRAAQKVTTVRLLIAIDCGEAWDAVLLEVQGN